MSESSQKMTTDEQITVGLDMLDAGAISLGQFVMGLQSTIQRYGFIESEELAKRVRKVMEDEQA